MFAVTSLIALLALTGVPTAAQKKPNIVFNMGKNVGWANIGVYNQGIMAGRTPNLDRLASESMRFTDYTQRLVVPRAALTLLRATSRSALDSPP